MMIQTQITTTLTHQLYKIYTHIPRSVPTLVEMKSYVYNKIPTTANNSQPPILSTDSLNRQLVWGSNDDYSATQIMTMITLLNN